MRSGASKQDVWQKERVRRLLPFVFGLAVLAAALATGCGVVRPTPQIVGAVSRDGISDTQDYTVWVDCTVKNKGAGGNVLVVAALRSDSFWSRQESVFMARDTERKFTFAFPEAEPLDAGLGGYRYSCGADVGGKH